MSDTSVESTVVDAEPARPVSDAAATPTGKGRAVTFRPRFAGVYLVLAMIAGAAVGAFVVLAARPDPAPTPPWSSFQPEGSSSAKLHQIVNTIPGRYRRADGSQLVTVSASAPQAPAVSEDGQSVVPVPVQRIAYEEGGDFKTLETADALQFTLCGNGANCTIDTGQPSPERFDLIQREALELALYTFKYMDEVGSVTVLLPPSFTAQPDGKADASQVRRTALFLQREDVEQALAQPLRASLAAQTPAIGKADARDLATIRRLSTPNVYVTSLTQAQDGAVVLVLRPALGS